MYISKRLIVSLFVFRFDYSVAVCCCFFSLLWCPDMQKNNNGTELPGKSPDCYSSEILISANIFVCSIRVCFLNRIHYLMISLTYYANNAQKIIIIQLV